MDAINTFLMQLAQLLLWVTVIAVMLATIVMVFDAVLPRKWRR